MTINRLLTEPVSTLFIAVISRVESVSTLFIAVISRVEPVSTLFIAVISRVNVYLCCIIVFVCYFICVVLFIFFIVYSYRFSVLCIAMLHILNKIFVLDCVQAENAMLGF